MGGPFRRSRESNIFPSVIIQPSLVTRHRENLFIHSSHESRAVYPAHCRTHQHRHLDVLLLDCCQKDVYQRTHRFFTDPHIPTHQSGSLYRHCRNPSFGHLPRSIYRLGRQCHPHVLQYCGSHGISACHPRRIIILPIGLTEALSEKHNIGVSTKGFAD